MIASMTGAMYVSESTTNESMLLGVYIAESATVVTTVFVIHPFI